MKYKRSFFHKNRLSIGIILGLLNILPIYWISIALYGALVIEGSCNDEAFERTGKEAYTLIRATAYEVKHWPQFIQNDMIYKVNHEILTCEHKKGEKLKNFIFL